MTAREQFPEDGHLNAEHPWLGLVSFTEAASSYFHGREEEVGELVRRVQRKTLTVLFGQSGLGKTSILNAGVVPRLRGQGYCPVYVRIDYAAQAPSPSDQIKQAILRETRAQGRWTQAGVAIEGESLWEFLHHRDDLLYDADGKPVLPLMIFDQFEELFTLAQSDEAGRQKAALFIADLADLVENRAPQPLEARMAEDDAVAEAFDFSRSDYRVLLALREDYLAQLESLKAQMPSITQNRMRLAPMTGVQAMAAVRGPGGHLVTDEVAGAIVRFVAGGAELANAEVEPSLLSLICRELNDARLGKGQPEISVDLLAGSHAAILTDFYERALIDQPAAVRDFIEDVLMTDSGYRENVAEERVRREFAAAGAAPDALALLVNRRLLRIEERLDLRRVELTHDVLCNVVRASRDARRERESREEAQAQLAAQQERARRARRQLRQARRIAAGCIVLAIGAAVAGGYAYWSSQRAMAAERLANQSRTQAEGLMSYLLDDFYRELEPLGRLDIIIGLGHQAVDYYGKLPEALRNNETERNYALAESRLGEAMGSQNKLKEATPLVDDAVQRLDRLRTQGDNSEATIVGQAQALRTQSRLFASKGSWKQSQASSEHAAQLLQPLAEPAKASPTVLEADAQVLNNLGYDFVRQNENALALKPLRASQALAARIGGADAKDLTQPLALRATADYINVAPWLMEALRNLGRSDEAREAGQQALQRAALLLQLQPEHGGVLYSRALINLDLSELDSDALNMQRAAAYAQDSISDWQRLLQRDPSNGRSWNNMANALGSLAIASWEAGQVSAALKAGKDAGSASAKAPETAFSLFNRIFGTSITAFSLADSGDLPAAQTASAEAQRLAAHFAALSGASNLTSLSLDCLTASARVDLVLAGARDEHAEEALDQLIQRTQKAPVPGPNDHWNQQMLCARLGNEHQATFQEAQGQHAAAEQSIAQALKTFEQFPAVTLPDQREQAVNQIWLALSQARQGHLPEARASLAPALKLESALDARHHDSQLQHFEMTQAWFVQALTEPAQRTALLARAAARIKSLPAELQALRSVRRWHDWIAAEQQVKG